MRDRMPVVGRRVVVVGFAVLAASLWVTSALGATSSFSGSVSAGGALYNKSIPVSDSGTISATISWSTPSAVLTVAVVNPSGAQVAINSTNANPKTVTFNATDTGSYKIRVKAKSGSSDFTGSVTYPGISVPTFAAQLGGGTMGHATMYPSGLDVGPDGTIYVADTGNDQVAAYNQSGTQLWRKGASRQPYRRQLRQPARPHLPERRPLRRRHRQQPHPGAGRVQRQHDRVALDRPAIHARHHRRQGLGRQQHHPCQRGHVQQDRRLLDHGHAQVHDHRAIDGDGAERQAGASARRRHRRRRQRLRGRLPAGPHGRVRAGGRKHLSRPP